MSASVWQAAPVHKPGIGAVIAAVLLPPLGIFLARGIGPLFWFGVLATILFWVPGIVFALMALFRPDLLGRLNRLACATGGGDGLSPALPDAPGAEPRGRSGGGG